MQFCFTVRSSLIATLVVSSSAACSLLDLDALSSGAAPDQVGGSGGAGGSGAATTGSGPTGGSSGSGAAPSGSGPVGSGGASSSAQSAASTGSGCRPICNPGETTYVDCAPCYKRPDTCSSDGCSISQGECTAFQCLDDQICGGGGQCCFGDSHSCDNAGQCCGGVCAGSFCYSCKPYGEPCANSAECCPGAPYCDFGTCVNN